MRLLGVDYGKRNIGVAVSDELGIGARGVETLRGLADGAAVARLARLADELGVESIVVGLPVAADGSIGDAARHVLRFVERLRGAVGVPVNTVGERLTSVAADERMREMGMRPDDRRKRVDEFAAVIILEEYMSALAVAAARERSADG